MPKVTDHELDKLVREMADRIVPEFNPGDWEDMARRLDMEETAARARSKTLYTMVALLLIYSLVPKWGSDSNKQFTSIASGLESTDQQAEITIREQKVPDRVIEENQNVEQLRVDKQKNGQTPASVPTTEQNNSKQERQETTRQHSAGMLGGNDRDGSLTRDVNTNVSGGAIGDIAAIPSVETDGSELLDLLPIESQHSSRKIKGTSVLESFVIDPRSIVKPVQLVSPLRGTTTIIREDPGKRTRPWFIKLPVSPDFSSIDYKKPGDPGINIGLLGEYQVGRHISLSTGAIWSKKLYDTENPDKSYSSGNWTAKASKLEGDCRVLDIPINITYYIFPKRRTNLFVTVGASSYIMLKEQYVYTVWANHKEYQYEEEFSHKNNEWFSMLNVSVGIQQRLGKGFFLQAEPFLKAPMSGVGEGKVNLVSTGVFVSLKYQLTR